MRNEGVRRNMYNLFTDQVFVKNEEMLVKKGSGVMQGVLNRQGL